MDVNGHFGGWTVYDHPSDYPDCYVARMFFLKRERGQDLLVMTDEILKSTDLESIRDALRAKGLECIEEEDPDEPQIMESWI